MGHQVRAACRPSRMAGVVAAAFLIAGCSEPPSVPLRAVDVRVEAQKRTWGASYILSEQGRTSELPTGREIHVPVGASVRLRLSSRDYLSDFAISKLQLRNFATPRLPSDLYFVADRPGRFEMRGEELCGLPHTDRTRGWLVVEDAASFTAWFKRRVKEGSRG